MLYQIIALILWSSAFIAAKYTYTMTDPLLMLLCRLLLASLLVLPAALRFGRSLEKRHWRPLLWLTFLNYVVVLAMQFVGLKYTSATSASTIVGLEPLLMVFIGHFFFRDFARWYHWLCGLVAFIGVALLIAGSGGEGDISLFGCLLVFAIQWIFLGDLRSALIVSANIPFALFFAVIILVLRGESANLLSVGAIDFGLIVDATVIMVEAIFRRLSQTTPLSAAEESHISPETMMGMKSHAILSAAADVSRSIFFAAAIIIAAFLPLFTLSGVEGNIFGPMARTYAYALAGGLLATFTVTP
ncbi:MAG: efflux RND transporter permease subunit, partial [Eikenella corrodens]|nr:efflux RND transporter permease subunit [Eikenella corrodens]